MDRLTIDFYYKADNQRQVLTSLKAFIYSFQLLFKMKITNNKQKIH